MRQKQRNQHLISPCRNDAHKYAEHDGCRNPQVRFGGVGDVVGEKLLAILPGQFTEKFRGTIQRKVTSTSTVFRILIRVKSRNGRK